jgi:hypothetical protein
MENLANFNNNKKIKEKLVQFTLEGKKKNPNFSQFLSQKWRKKSRQKK